MRRRYIRNLFLNALFVAAGCSQAYTVTGRVVCERSATPVRRGTAMFGYRVWAGPFDESRVSVAQEIIDGTFTVEVRSDQKLYVEVRAPGFLPFGRVIHDGQEVTDSRIELREIPAVLGEAVRELGPLRMGGERAEAFALKWKEPDGSDVIVGEIVPVRWGPEGIEEIRVRGGRMLAFSLRSRADEYGDEYFLEAYRFLNLIEVPPVDNSWSDSLIVSESVSGAWFELENGIIGKLYIVLNNGDETYGTARMRLEVVFGPANPRRQLLLPRSCYEEYPSYWQ